MSIIVLHTLFHGTILSQVIEELDMLLSFHLILVSPCQLPSLLCHIVTTVEQYVATQ